MSALIIAPPEIQGSLFREKKLHLKAQLPIGDERQSQT
jgi:hypothetical protein